jgi:protein phosphatase
MKILILSDIHANWPALQAVLAAEPQVDGVICLGDLVNYGPHPVECVRWAQANAVPDWIVQGNHDRAVGCDEDPRCSAPYRPLAAAMQRYTAGRLDAAAKAYLAGLPAGEFNKAGNARCFLCHAIPSDPLYGYLQLRDPRARWEAEIHLANRPDFLLVGHTHQPCVRLINSTLVVNPGSVGQPKGGDPRASYALWSDGDVMLRRAEYDVRAVARDLAFCELPDVARDLTHVLLTGGDLALQFNAKTGMAETRSGAPRPSGTAPEAIRRDLEVLQQWNSDAQL